MIYTLTINPSIDYVMEMDELKPGKMNRSKSTYMLPGGKGINVSTVLKRLGMENVAVLPIAGFSGEKLLEMISKENLSYDAFRLQEGDTRINVKVLGKNETELNAEGPSLTEEERELFIEKFECLTEGDYLVLSGSVPKALGGQFYAAIMKKLHQRGVKIVVDTIGDNFVNALENKPFLVKPNKEELENLFAVKADTDEELLELAKKVQTMGAENVLVSLGDKGAFLVTKDNKLLQKNAPKGQAVNTVGAGDSMVAGFLAGYLKTGDMETALKWGIAAGSASAFSKNLATKEEIDALMKKLC